MSLILHCSCLLYNNSEFATMEKKWQYFPSMWFNVKGNVCHIFTERPPSSAERAKTTVVKLCVTGSVFFLLLLLLIQYRDLKKKNLRKD